MSLSTTVRMCCASEKLPSFPVPEGDPYFTLKLQDYTAVEKDKVVLDCELSKDVDVMWYHSEAEVRASKLVTIKAEGKRRTLILKKVTDADQGQYVCDCGTDKTTATVYIEGKRADLLRQRSAASQSYLLWPLPLTSTQHHSTPR